MDFDFIVKHWGEIAAAWLIIEQVLASTNLKSSSSFQLVCNTVDSMIAKCKKEPAK